MGKNARHNENYKLMPSVDYQQYNNNKTAILIEFSNEDNNNNCNCYDNTVSNCDYNRRIRTFRNNIGLILRYVYKCGYPDNWCFCRPHRTRKIWLLYSLILFILLHIGTLHYNQLNRKYPLQDWNSRVSRNISEYVLPYQKNTTTLLEPKNTCQNKIFLLIMVYSGVKNFSARQVIRETWGNISEFNYGTFAQLHANYKKPYAPVMEQRIELYKEYLQLNSTKPSALPYMLPVRILFLLGNHKNNKKVDYETIIRIQQEFKQYNDIIQEDFIDTYNNLTIKSVMALKWLLKNHCHERIAFFMKCDDDTFVNVPNLLHFLLGGEIPLYKDTSVFYNTYSFERNHQLNVTTNYLVGRRFYMARPFADISSKWYMPFDMYPKAIYPTYLSGAGYVMSSYVIPKLYAVALKTPIVYLEDIYITGICAEKANIPRQDFPLFCHHIPQYFCAFKGLITGHRLRDFSMYYAYNFVLNFNIHCPLPSESA